jgi:hypothetical protein
MSLFLELHIVLDFHIYVFLISASSLILALLYSIFIMFIRIALLIHL